MPDSKNMGHFEMRIGFSPENLEALKEMQESYRAAAAALMAVTDALMAVAAALKESPETFFKLIPLESDE